jgi:hypothetical protein
MDVVFDTSQPIFTDQYGRSRPSFPVGSGDYGSSVDRSRNSSTSYVNMELSPAMEFAFSSDSALSESDMDCWMNLVVDNDSTSPMSNNLSESEFFPASWNSHDHSAAMTQGFDIPVAQRASSVGSFQVSQYQHSSRPSNQGKTLPRSFLWFMF